MPILVDIAFSSINMIFYILVSFSFVIGIILMVVPQAFEALNEALQKEYGITKRFIPRLEKTGVSTIDRICKKHSVIIGMLISIASFFLLLIYR